MNTGTYYIRVRYVLLRDMRCYCLKIAGREELLCEEATHIFYTNLNRVFKLYRERFQRIKRVCVVIWFKTMPA
jgi:hypothetical protein